MTTQRIATTRSQDLRPLAGSGQTGIAAWGVLHALLVRELSAAHAALLAEPVVNEAQGTVDWYAAGEGAAARLIDLPVPEQAAVQARLDRLTTDIQALADRLRTSRAEADRLLSAALDQALRLPGPEFVHARGPQPVLVGWAHGRSGPGAGGAALTGQAWRAGAAPAAAIAAAAPPVRGAMAILPPPPSPFRTRPRSAAWRWSGLGAAALLGMLALGLLLRDPFGWFAIPVPQCRLEPGQLALEQGLQEAVAREAVLRTELARLAADAGRRRLLCPPVQAAAAPSPAPPATSADAGRAQRQGARSGKLQVILAWDDTNDLDLQVICPQGGGINFIRRQACGGMLDLDANGDVNHLTPTPVENVYFDDPAPGTYRVIVDPYGMRQAPSSAYRVTVRRDGRPDLVVTGTAQNGQRNRLVTEFTVEPPP